MKITLSDNINRIYVQSLCMAFFHGIKFPDSSQENSDNLELTVSAREEERYICCNAILKNKNEAFDEFLKYEKSSCESENREMKIAVGQVVYKLCQKITNKSIEWGILTGIRPSKVCAELLSKYSEQETFDILTNKYLLSAEKTRLCIDVAKNESAIMQLTNDQKCSIYVSIPFCPSRCTYCSFISYAGKKLFDLIPSYVEKLIEDIKSTIALINELNLIVSCIYIGGGTPTILSEEQLEAVLDTICGLVDVDALDEFTLEGGRPDTITDGKLSIAKKYGVKRISVNPQSLNDNVLKNIGRNHTRSDFFEAYNKVESAKIETVNTDLIAGLDGDDFESFKETLDKIIELGPENITVHTFCVKKSAQITRENEEIFNLDDSVAKNSVEYAYGTLLKNGYLPYYMYRQKNTIGNLENIGYSKKRHFGLYNVFMMSDAHTVFGIGAGATTKLVKNTNGKTKILRIFSHKYPYEYLRDEQKIDTQIKEFFMQEVAE